MRVSLYETTTGELIVRGHGSPLLYLVGPERDASFVDDASRLERDRGAGVGRNVIDLTSTPAREWPQIRLVAQWVDGTVTVEADPGPAARRYLQLGGR